MGDGFRKSDGAADVSNSEEDGFLTGDPESPRMAGGGIEID